MAKLPKLAAVLTTPDTRLADVLRLALVETCFIGAIARRLQLSRKTVHKLLGRVAECKPLSSEPRAPVLPVKLVPTITGGNNRRVRRRPGRRIRSVGAFTDLRQLRLAPTAGSRRVGSNSSASHARSSRPGFKRCIPAVFMW